MFNAIQIFPQTLLLQPINAVPPSLASFKIISKGTRIIFRHTCPHKFDVPFDARSVGFHFRLFLPKCTTRANRHFLPIQSSFFTKYHLISKSSISIIGYLGHSMCRQCCATDMCNRGWKIRSESGWQYDYLS